MADVYSVYMSPRGAISISPSTSESDLSYIEEIALPKWMRNGVDVSAVDIAAIRHEDFAEMLEIRHEIDRARYAKRTLPTFKSVRAA